MRHYLKPNKKCELPQDIVAIDVLGEKHHDRNSGKHWKERFSTFVASFARYRGGTATEPKSCLSQVRSDAWEFLRACTARKRKLTIVSFRMSRVLTLLDAWREFQESRLTFSLDCDECRRANGQCRVHKWRGYIIANDPPFVLHCRFSNCPGTVQFIDLRNFGDFHAKDFASFPESVNAYLEWFADWNRTISNYDLGNAACTVARQAFNSFRHTRPLPKILVHDVQEVTQLERQAYYGGRCEARFIGKIGQCNAADLRNRIVDARGENETNRINIYHLDYTWHYPAVMRCGLFPSILCGCKHGTSLAEVLRLRKEFLCIARCNISSKSDTYPIRRAGRALFARGNFWSSLAGPELDRALDNGDVSEIDMVAWYEPAQLFTAWVDKLWKLRQEAKASGDTKMESVIKRLGNSLYGRFAMKEHEWIDLPLHPASMPFGQWLDKTIIDGMPIECRSIDGNTQMRKVNRKFVTELDPATGQPKTFERLESNNASESCPAIAAFVTAYGREKLLSAIRVAGDRQVYYYDTDSLLCTERGYDNLRDSGMVAEGELGKLRLVDAYDSIEILGYKMLKRGNQKVACGIPVDAEFDRFGCVNYDTQNGMRGILGQAEKDSVNGRHHTANIKESYSHGRVRNDGWTEPFVLEQT